MKKSGRERKKWGENERVEKWTIEKEGERRKKERKQSTILRQTEIATESCLWDSWHWWISERTKSQRERERERERQVRDSKSFFANISRYFHIFGCRNVATGSDNLRNKPKKKKRLRRPQQRWNELMMLRVLQSSTKIKSWTNFFPLSLSLSHFHVCVRQLRSPPVGSEIKKQKYKRKDKGEARVQQ